MTEHNKSIIEVPLHSSDCEINIVEDDLELKISTDNTEIHVRSNYDIVSCYVEDDSFNLMELFEVCENVRSDNSSDNITTSSNNNEEILEKDEMQTLLQELKKKYSSDSSDTECFISNPLLKNNEKYLTFPLETVEQRAGEINWCSCFECHAMPTNIESICCREISNAEPFMADFQCIIEHEYFDIFCRREDTVNIVLRTIGQVLNTPPEKDVNRLKRKAAYRSFTAWIHGYLGAGNRRPIPACVVNTVRNCFPDPDEEYMGFKPHHDSPAEFMAFE